MHESNTDEWSGLPMMLKIEEAAGVLRIGRSKAYEMAQRYAQSGGTDGLPVLRMGDLLRVPRAALQEYVTTGRVVQLLHSGPTRRTPRKRSIGAAGRTEGAEDGQLSLLDTD
ncbi:MAG: hypothetical protein JWL72_3545 [Ilumatobacteraceae bacterium]|nr:hypothetical protein [Ilumatobacteraceae bacterium]